MHTHSEPLALYITKRHWVYNKKSVVYTYMCMKYLPVEGILGVGPDPVVVVAVCCIRGVTLVNIIWSSIIVVLFLKVTLIVMLHG